MNSTDDSPIYVEKTDPAERQRKYQPDVPGWGADLDPANRPAVPMERTPPRLPNLHWHEPEHQHSDVQVFHSTERPGLTPVYGTSTPPSGVSGQVRALAFRYSENDLRHWLMLLGADRINVVEGLLSDLAHGHIPNLFAEMGLGAEWRYNKAGFIRKAFVTGAMTALAIYLLRRRRRD
jgi:hypothetical protein